MQLTYSKFEHELNRFLKGYLKDDSYDRLKERLDPPENDVDKVSEKETTPAAPHPIHGPPPTHS